MAIKEYFPQDYAMREGSTGNLISPTNKLDSYSRWLTRFKREGQVLFDLNHPNIVRVLHLFEERNTVYLVMKYLEGRTLRDALEQSKSKGLPEDQIIKIMDGLVSALSTIHNQVPPLYHLDIKPENIMLIGENQPVLIDFGSARLGLRHGTPKYSTVAGTVDYAPPELGLGENIGQGSDIYELGLVLHEMLTGSLPKAIGVESRFGIEWDVQLARPWQEMIRAAIRMDVQARPGNVKAWWGRYERWVKRKASDLSVEHMRQDVEVQAASKPLEKVDIKERVKERPGHRWFRFEVVSLSPTGQITEREEQHAQLLIERLPGGIDLEMVWIDGGVFEMGSPASELERRDSETPQHRVQIPGFYLGRYAVTQEQWTSVMGSNPSKFKGKRRPVENVSWDDVQEFCRKLKTPTGKAYRLPSESEWEYACRARTTTPFSFGETITTAVANYRGIDHETYGWSGSYGQGPKGDFRGETTDVGQFPPNRFGLYDMHGNVWEWCQDKWHETYKGGFFSQGAPKDGSAWESGNDSRRVLRGGSWYFGPWLCRSAGRYRWFPGVGDNDFGFRLALSASGIS